MFTNIIPKGGLLLVFALYSPPNPIHPYSNHDGTHVSQTSTLSCVRSMRVAAPSSLRIQYLGGPGWKETFRVCRVYVYGRPT